LISCTSCGASCEDGAEPCGTCGQPPVTSDPRIGRVIADRYEVRELLGRGGMGVVYKAYDRLLEEVVALKLLRGEMASPDLARRFRDEIRFARRVSHRNVCRIHEYGESGALRFISMAFVDGVDLKHVLAREGPLAPAVALETGRAVAAGLSAIHDEGIVHRDLKTANIMRDGRGVVRLMDFGIAKDWSSGGSSGQTATGVIVGTPEYMSPEQAMGRRIDVRSDLYSLGIVLYELFTARVPFRGDTPMATLLRHIQEPLRLDTVEAALVPEAVRPLLAKALAKSPDERFASASEMAEALAVVQRAFAPEAVATPPVDAPTLGRGASGSPVPMPTPTPWPTRTRTATAMASPPAPTPVPDAVVTELIPPTQVARTPPLRPRPVASAPAAPMPRLLWPAAILGPVLLLAIVGFVTWRMYERQLGPSTPTSVVSILSPSPVVVTPSPVPLPVATPEMARVAPTPVAIATPRGPAPAPAPTRVAMASTAGMPPKPPPAPVEGGASVTVPSPRADAAAAQAAWDAVVRIADDPARPEAERMAELRRYVAAAAAGPHRTEAAARLARLEEDARRRLLAPPDAATLGRQRRATYVGGTLSQIAEGSVGSVAFPDKERMVLLTGGRFTVVPFRGVSGIEYGLTDRMRGIVFKKKSHYLSLTYRDAAGEDQGMVLELAGDEFRPVLTMLEARTGQKVQYQDEKAARERWK
jgi:serine/threonine protein kinase